MSVVHPLKTDVLTDDQKRDNNDYEKTTLGVTQYSETQDISIVGTQDNREYIKMVPYDTPSQETQDQTTPSLGGEVETLVCKEDNRGRCMLHNVQMSKIMISSKKWVKKNKKGVCEYGWKFMEVPKFICKMKNTPDSRIPNMNTSERFGEYDTNRMG